MAGASLGASFITKPAFFTKPLCFSNQFQISPALFTREIKLRTRCTVDETMSIDDLRSFFDINLGINLGKWEGSFYQFDARGNLLNNIPTKLSVTVKPYGEDKLISLFQSLYVKQAPSSTSISVQEEKTSEWIECKVKEINIINADKYHQICFLPKEKAFSLRYQTAGVLEKLLRVGVLGEDDSGEENPKNLKIPSRRPSVVCENCLYSLDKERRIRVFYTLEPRGVLEMVFIFVEDQENEPPLILNSLPNIQEKSDRISPFLGIWKGRSVTKRSAEYGGTIAEAHTYCALEMNEQGQIIQTIRNTTVGTNITPGFTMTGSISQNTVNFSGYEMTFLPSGIYFGCPADISKCVAKSNPFPLELCWMESPNERQRLVRTYDWEGVTVSTTYYREVRV